MLPGNWPETLRDRAAFLGVFFIGLFTILAGTVTARGSGGLPWVVLVLLIALMVVYAGLAHYWSVRHWGDMCYYMGFLFTLVSMMVALRQYTAGTSLDEIIPTFALALGTTVTGLVLRVMGDEQAAEEQDGDLPFHEPAIQGGAQRVGKALDGLANEIERVQRDLRGGGSTILASLRDVLVDPVTGHAVELGRALDDMSERTARAGEVFGTVSSDIDARWKQTWAQLEAPSEEVAAFAREVTGLTAGLRGLADAHSTALGSLKSIRDTSAEVLDQSRSVLSMQGQAVEELRSVVESVLRATKEAHDHLIATADQIDARTTNLQSTLGSWQSAIDAMAKAGEQQAALLGDLHGSVVELDRCVAGIPAAVVSITDGAAKVHQAGTQIGAASKGMERLSDELARFPRLLKVAHREGAELLGSEMDRSLAKVTESLRRAIRDAVDEAGHRALGKGPGLVRRLFSRRGR